MTLIMVRCKRCAAPIDLVARGVHRTGRGRGPDRYVHTDTNRARRGVIAGRSLWGVARPDLARLVRDTIAALDARYTLVEVSGFDGGLTPRQIQVLLDGGNEYESSEFSFIEEDESDRAFRASIAAVRKLLDDDQYDLLDEADLLDETRWEIQDRNESDSLADQLLRASRSHLFRFDLGVDVPDHTVTSDAGDDTRKVIADAAGLDLDHPPSAALVESLVANAFNGGRLYVLWNTDPADAVALAAPYDPGDARGTVTFTGASLLVLDSWNGSGHDAEVPVITAE